MPASQRRLALALLLAALAHPAWAVAHSALHVHIAEHHAGETPHHPANASDVLASETRQHASAERSDDHDHDHEHLASLFLRPTRGNDFPWLIAPAATPRPCTAATQRWQITREAAPTHAGPGAASPSDPRAPPLA